MSWASSEGVRRSMRSNRSSGTRPELRLRSALHAAGLRYRVQHPVPGARRRRIDVAFTRLRIAVYVDGCFWHGCPRHPFVPKRNADYWAEKFAANRARDAATDDLLRTAGWLALRIWEHEPVPDAVERVLLAVQRRREALTGGGAAILDAQRLVRRGETSSEPLGVETSTARATRSEARRPPAGATRLEPGRPRTPRRPAR